MSTAGPNDEQNGDELEGIHFFDFTDPLTPNDPPAKPAPFATEGLPAAADTPSETGEPPKPKGPAGGPPTVDPFEYALTGVPHHQADSASEPADRRLPAIPRPVTPQRSTTQFFQLSSLFEPAEPRSSSRERFVSVFDACRTEGQRPFFAIALRMPAGARTAAQFPVVVEGIHSALAVGDALLADSERFRLVAVFQSRPQEEARAVFAQLKDYLRAWATDPDAALRAISALVAPAGRPFRDANEFLARAFDEE